MTKKTFNLTEFHAGKTQLLTQIKVIGWLCIYLPVTVWLAPFKEELQGLVLSFVFLSFFTAPVVAVGIGLIAHLLDGLSLVVGLLASQDRIRSPNPKSSKE